MMEIKKDNRGFVEDTRIEFAKKIQDPNALIDLADEKFKIAKELYKLADSVFREGRELQGEAMSIMFELFFEYSKKVEEESNE